MVVYYNKKWQFQCRFEFQKLPRAGVTIRIVDNLKHLNFQLLLLKILAKKITELLLQLNYSTPFFTYHLQHLPFFSLRFVGKSFWSLIWMASYATKSSQNAERLELSSLGFILRPFITAFFMVFTGTMDLPSLNTWYYKMCDISF